MKKTFSKEKLFDRTPRVFKRDATEVRFCWAESEQVIFL